MILERERERDNSIKIHSSPDSINPELEKDFENKIRLIEKEEKKREKEKRTPIDTV